MRACGQRLERCDYKPRDTRDFQLSPGAREGQSLPQNPQKESTLGTPWSLSYSFQSCERINVVLRYPVVAVLCGNTSERIQEHAKNPPKAGQPSVDAETWE